MYTENDRRKDFDYFVENRQELYDKYGHTYIAIRNESVLGCYGSIPEAISQLADQYEIGNYIVQECTDDDSGYKTTIMRLIIQG